MRRRPAFGPARSARWPRSTTGTGKGRRQRPSSGRCPRHRPASATWRREPVRSPGCSRPGLPAPSSPPSPTPGWLPCSADRTPGVPVVRARGEALPWADGSLDALVVSSAWHWMDPEPTVAEIARVLRPGGIFGVFGSGPDREVRLGRRSPRWLARPRRLATPSQPAHLVELPPDAPFTAPDTTVIRWTRPMTRRELVGLAGTYSRSSPCPTASGPSAWPPSTESPPTPSEDRTQTTTPPSSCPSAVGAGGPPGADASERRNPHR